MKTSLLAILLKITVPDPVLTPGDLCREGAIGYESNEGGWAHCRRVVSQATKRKVLKLYGIPWSLRDHYEIDHRVPLCMGGSNAISNLWPEMWPHAHKKDVIEARLCRRLREGRITQELAVEEMLGTP